LADRSIKYPHGIVEDLLVNVDKFLFPVDFVVMDIAEDAEVPLILGRPFMKTVKVIIDVDKGKLKVCVQDEDVSFNAFEAMKYSNDQKECFRVDVIDDICFETQKKCLTVEPLMKVIMGSIEDINEGERKEIQDYVEELDKAKEILYDASQKQDLIKEEISQPQKIESKQLPTHLKYVFLAENGEKPVIISNSLTAEEEEEVVKVLKSNKGAKGWTLSDLKGISPSYCMHKIHME